MSSQEKPHFRFKQFSIWHDQCAMKVSTDGILLGAWSFLAETTKAVLDIGTGTGLLSLMVAQRLKAANETSPEFKITAVELDPNASQQAKFNAQQSPWPDNITVINDNILQWTQTSSQTFDVIVCNPPYFSNSLNSANTERNQARHNNGLPFRDLFQVVKKHLAYDGYFNVILPLSELNAFLRLAEDEGLTLSKQTLVQPSPKKAASRALLTFVNHSANQNTEIKQDTIVVRTEQGEYHPSFVTWCQPFYLKMV